MESARCVQGKKWRGYYQSMTFLVVEHVRYSVSQFTLGIPRKNSSYLHTKQLPLWLYVSSSHPVNNIAAQKILIYARYYDDQVYAPTASC